MADNSTTTDPTNYLPPGEGPAELYIERTNYNGVTIGAFFFGTCHNLHSCLCSLVSQGIHFTLFLVALHYLISGKAWSRVQWGMVTYIVSRVSCAIIGTRAETPQVLLFSAAAVYTGADSKWGEQMFIDDR